MLHIQRATNGGVTFVLSGRVEIEDVAELQRLLALEQGNRQITFDLAEVTLVDREAVKFLANCEADQIKLENCPSYIRAWVDMEKRRNRRPET
jgi:hypothetical protein